MADGITTAGLGQPNFKNALKQHSNYIKALEACGVEVTILEADEKFPDSTFVEDVALLTTKCAVVTNPGAQSRKGEIVGIQKVLRKFYTDIERIQTPGTVEAGDIIMVGSHFYIGLSARTNENCVRCCTD